MFVVIRDANQKLRQKGRFITEKDPFCEELYKDWDSVFDAIEYDGRVDADVICVIEFEANDAAALVHKDTELEAYFEEWKSHE